MTTRADLLRFLRSHRYAVEASVSPSQAAQAAVVGIVVTDTFEILFDTLDSTRKLRNLRQNPRIALVVGGLDAGDERTAQVEGLADEPWGEELARLKRSYYEVFPDGIERSAWPGLVYVRTKPTWIRFSDFRRNPAAITEFDFSTSPAMG